MNVTATRPDDIKETRGEGRGAEGGEGGGGEVQNRKTNNGAVVHSTKAHSYLSSDTSASRAVGPGFNSHLRRGNFPGPSRTSDFFFFFFCVPQLYLWGSPFLDEIFAYVTVFLIQPLR